MARPYKNRTAWTPDEDALLLSRIAKCEPVIHIHRSFPNRTEASVKGRIQKLRLDVAGRDQRSVSTVKATAKLEKAIKALMERMPAREVALVLGGPTLVIPGTERPYIPQAAFGIAA